MRTQQFRTGRNFIAHNIENILRIYRVVNLIANEMVQVQVGNFWSVCDKKDLLLKYFDHIANFVDTILLYMYVFCFDICKLFLKILILTQLQQYKVRCLLRILRKQRALFFTSPSRRTITYVDFYIFVLLTMTKQIIKK